MHSAIAPATFTTHDPVPWLDTTFNYGNASFTDDHTQGRLQIALNFDSGLLVTAIQASAEYNSGNDAKLCFWTDTMTVEASRPGQQIPVSHGVLDGFHYYPIISGFRAAAMVADDWQTETPHIYLYVPDAVSKPEMTVWRWELHSNSTSGTMRDTSGLLRPTTLPEDNTSVLGVENLSAVGGALMPTALIWTKRSMSSADTRLWACTFDIARMTWHWIELPVPDSVRAREDVPIVSTALTPRSQENPDKLNAHSLLDVFLVIEGTLHVFRQVESTSAEADGILPAYTPIIPLQPGVEMMTSGGRDRGPCSGDGRPGRRHGDRNHRRQRRGDAGAARRRSVGTGAHYHLRRAAGTGDGLPERAGQHLHAGRHPTQLPATDERGHAGHGHHPGRADGRAGSRR